MLTYPSTHGVYEERVREVTDLVHRAGGQVYIDGANLNALVGLARPREPRWRRLAPQPAQDVLHPPRRRRSGRRPDRRRGAPRAVPAGRPHPGRHASADAAADGTTTETGAHGRHVTPPVAAANWGSAGILPIAWAYVTLMGPDGLTHATRTAVLAANYLASRLTEHFPVLYTGPAGLVAHECILDLRPITKATGVTAEDVAKRLMDYGFHAPTLSFPVAGTLMVEPTESEDLGEARPVRRRARRDPPRDRPGRRRHVAARGLAAAQRPAHRVVPGGRRVDPPVPPRDRRLRRPGPAARQVLAARPPHRRRPRRPSGSSAPARPSRPSRTDHHDR